MRYPFNKLPGKFKPTGFLVSTKDVRPDRGNSIEGIVRSGALRFSHQCLAGDFRHETVSGTGRIDIEGTVHNAPAGTVVVVPTGKRFTYLNDSGSDWHFKATHPFWKTAAFNYFLDGSSFGGDDVWFEIRLDPASTEHRPLYRLIPVADGMNSAVVAVEHQAETIGFRTAVHSHVITPLLGQGHLSIGLGQPGRVHLDRPLRVVPGEVHRIVNDTGSTALFHVRSDTPRVWTPGSHDWEASPGKFVSGDAIWFEFVFPQLN